MLRIGVCDDEEMSRQTLHGVLERLLDKEDIACTVFEFSSGEGVTGWLQKHPGELDILFLDIEMGGMSGMETAAQIRKENSALIIVFVTGYADYVFDGYTVGAMGYLTKPVDAVKLKEVVVRALGNLQKHSPENYAFSNPEGMYRISKKDILYFQSDRRQVILVTQKRKYAFYAKLDDVQTEVGSGFVRVHQRYLVRAGAVSGVEGNTVFVGEEALPISRGSRKQAMLAIAGALLDGEDYL